MGDLPIFVAHDSAECWARPDLFYLDEKFQTTVVAGVPPDSMAPLGQRWGTPLYRWDLMAKENFDWWIARVKRALTQADLIRIDHFRGFAGYFEIPGSCPDATQGRWVDAPGKALFAAIEAALLALDGTNNDINSERAAHGILAKSYFALADQTAAQREQEWINAHPNPETASRLAELARAANVFATAGLPVSTHTLRRKVAGGATLLEAIFTQGNAVQVAQSLVGTLQRENRQKERLSQQLASRKRVPANPADYGAPSLTEER